jgi:transcription initiation factor IIE alpha subunit
MPDEDPASFLETYETDPTCIRCGEPVEADHDAELCFGCEDAGAWEE